MSNSSNIPQNSQGVSETKQQLISLTIKTLTGTSRELTGFDVTSDTFAKVADEIQYYLGIPSGKLRMMHNKKICALEDKLSDHDIKDKDVVYLVVSLRKS